MSSILQIIAFFLFFIKNGNLQRCDLDINTKAKKLTKMNLTYDKNSTGLNDLKLFLTNNQNKLIRLTINNQSAIFGQNLTIFNKTCSNILNLSNNRIDNLPHRLFDGLLYVDKLYLSYNQLNDMSLFFKNINQSFCCFIYLTLLDLSYNLLESFKHNNFQYLVSLEVLILTGNNFKSLKSEDFGKFTGLVKILINKNHIQYIEDKLLYKMTSLTDKFAQINIDLSENQIESINVNTFFNLQKVYKLDLDSNKISYLENNSFNSLINVYNLTISNNCLSIFNLTMITRYLAYLSLSNNSIRELKLTSQYSLRSLISLDVSYNKIEKIDEFFFNNMTQLQNLYLKNNLIDKTPHFGTINSLEFLDLSMNQITSLRSNSLNNFTKLKYLNLTDNKISSIDSDAFNRAISLTHLFISMQISTKLDIVKLKKSLQPILVRKINDIKFYRSISLISDRFECSIALFFMSKNILFNYINDDQIFHYFMENCQNIYCNSKIYTEFKDLLNLSKNIF